MAEVSHYKEHSEPETPPSSYDIYSAQLKLCNAAFQNDLPRLNTCTNTAEDDMNKRNVRASALQMAQDDVNALNELVGQGLGPSLEHLHFGDYRMVGGGGVGGRKGPALQYWRPSPEKTKLVLQDLADLQKTNKFYVIKNGEDDYTLTVPHLGP